MVFCLAAFPVSAGELVMFETASCPWCLRWHAEIGPVYPNTPESKCAPLRLVDLEAERPDDLKDIHGIKFTPTFVVMNDGHEVGRLVGYPGEDFFWPLLADQLLKLPGGCPN